MRIRQLLSALALAALSCAILSGCAGGGRTGTAHSDTSAPAPSPAGNSLVTERVGSPGNPLTLSCGQESFAIPPVSQRPHADDLVIGPLIIVGGERLATENPADYGSNGSYKIPVIVTPGSTVTITIAAPVRGRVVIDNPYSPVGGVVAATYHSCSRKPGFFAQGFTLTQGQVRDCVPLDVHIDDQAGVRHVTLSLFAGPCTHRPAGQGSAAVAKAAKWNGPS